MSLKPSQNVPKAYPLVKTLSDLHVEVQLVNLAVDAGPAVAGGVVLGDLLAIRSLFLFGEFQVATQLKAHQPPCQIPFKLPSASLWGVKKIWTLN